ncbi:MAG: hypothetical protein DMG78_11540 [Acidobacteria bacterium]|nr:MAG: hypothetical protein DMG78_11540 [Acidobacteriota bacterium]
MSIQEVAPEQLAQLFHRYHQALAPYFHCSEKASPGQAGTNMRLHLQRCHSLLPGNPVQAW